MELKGYLQYSIKEMIELFYPVYLVANKMPELYFDMGQDNETGESIVYGCNLSENNGTVVNISCCQAVAWGSGFKLFDDENLEEDLIAALPKLEKVVSFASLNKNHLS